MRWLRHLCSRSARSAFPEPSLERIARAIAEGERLHGGQVMFAVEADLPLPALWRGVGARERAEHAFALLRTWDTQANNGVLVYLLLADHALEIVADRGLQGRVDAAQWRQLCERFAGVRRTDGLEAAVVATVNEVSRLLALHYPPVPGQGIGNELPDRPQLLG